MLFRTSRIEEKKNQGQEEQKLDWIPRRVGVEKDNQAEWDILVEQGSLLVEQGNRLVVQDSLLVVEDSLLVVQDNPLAEEDNLLDLDKEVDRSRNNNKKAFSLNDSN